MTQFLTSLIVGESCLYDVGHIMQIMQALPLASFRFIKPFVTYLKINVKFV